MRILELSLSRYGTRRWISFSSPHLDKECTVVAAIKVVLIDRKSNNG